MPLGSPRNPRQRGDDIILVTRPTNKADYITKDKSLKGNYAKELEYLVRKNYKPKNITDTEWNTIKPGLNDT